ncbi:hypothetical protein ACH5RR_032337 [Cinchona calisaya]|uniref:Uncharacterized protein n=1 Tax=Cinchona calisaya TaxID=153742 RepID=A0ABD2YLA4_9GENT
MAAVAATWQQSISSLHAMAIASSKTGYQIEDPINAQRKAEAMIGYSWKDHSIVDELGCVIGVIARAKTSIVIDQNCPSATKRSCEDRHLVAVGHVS